jgi:hypothetical protein
MGWREVLVDEATDLARQDCFNAQRGIQKANYESDLRSITQTRPYYRHGLGYSVPTAQRPGTCKKVHGEPLITAGQGSRLSKVASDSEVDQAVFHGLAAYLEDCCELFHELVDADRTSSESMMSNLADDHVPWH